MLGHPGMPMAVEPIQPHHFVADVIYTPLNTPFVLAARLKGSRTIVAQRDQPLSFNSTGNPGMAKGGMGDVLTGVCAGLIGQGLSLYNAARVGAWLCGRSAEIAIFQNGASEQSLLPSDVLDNLGRAFVDLEIGSTL
jgi:NAD(P)H-hydrate epimerase